MDSQTFLEKWVLQDGKPITARLLSLLQECHISEAHKAMSQFEEESRTRDGTARPFVSWIVKGTLKAEPKATSASQQSMSSMDVDDDESEIINEGHLLVTEEQLEEVKSRFEHISLKQIYSFSPAVPKKGTKPHKISALSQLTTIHHEIHNNKEYNLILEKTDRGAKLGTIRSAESRKRVSKISPSIPLAGPSNSKIAGKASPQVKKEAVLSRNEKKVETKTSAITTKEISAKANGNSKSKRKLVDSDEEDKEERLKTNSKAIKEDDEDSDEGPIGYADNEEKPKPSNKAKEKAEANRKGADASDAASAEEEKRQKRKQELMDMMDEDEDGQADPPAIEPSESTSTSMMKGSEVEKESVQKDEATEEAAAPKKRVRKQRKVIRKEKTKDSKGYTRTQDIEAYESYSSEESDDNDKGHKKSLNENRPSTAAAMSKGSSNNGQDNSSASKKPSNTSSGNANGGGAAGGQRKLSSFFSKGNKK